MVPIGPGHADKINGFCSYLVGMRSKLQEFFLGTQTYAFLGALAWLAVAAVGLWVLSGQVWRFILPQGVPHVAVVSNPVEAAAAVAGRHLFGLSGQGDAHVPVTTGSYRLLGVIAASAGRPSAAVIQIQGGSTVVAGEGAEVEPGVRVSAVEAKGIRLMLRNGETEVSLPERSSAGR